MFVLESTHNRRWVYALFAVLAALALVLVACGGDNDEDEDEHAEMDMSSETSQNGGDHEMAHEEEEPGVVHPKPAGATEVRISLTEWTIEPSVTSVAAGEIYFLVDNLGPEHPHELVIIRSDLAADALPTIHDGSVPEDAVDLIGEIEEFTPASSASGLFDLTPGTYLLICNIVETTGNLESHYAEGMRVAFAVE